MACVPSVATCKFSKQTIERHVQKQVLVSYRAGGNLRKETGYCAHSPSEGEFLLQCNDHVVRLRVVRLCASGVSATSSSSSHSPSEGKFLLQCDDCVVRLHASGAFTPSYKSLARETCDLVPVSARPRVKAFAFSKTKRLSISSVVRVSI